MKYIARHLLPLLFAAAAVFVHAPAAAQQDAPARVGVINIDRIFREANIAKAAQAKIEQEFSKREKDINDLAAGLKTASDRFEREAPTLAESQRATRQRQLVDMERDLQRKRREFQEDLNARKFEEQQQVIERTNRVLKQVAEQEKYDLIVQEAAYFNPKLDITDKVIKALNGAK
jgi:outer membrane protein